MQMHNQFIALWMPIMFIILCLVASTGESEESDGEEEEKEEEEEEEELEDEPQKSQKEGKQKGKNRRKSKLGKNRRKKNQRTRLALQEMEKQSQKQQQQAQQKQATNGTKGTPTDGITEAHCSKQTEPRSAGNKDDEKHDVHEGVHDSQKIDQEKHLQKECEKRDLRDEDVASFKTREVEETLKSQVKEDVKSTGAAAASGEEKSETVCSSPTRSRGPAWESSYQSPITSSLKSGLAVVMGVFAEKKDDNPATPSHKSVDQEADGVDVWEVISDVSDSVTSDKETSGNNVDTLNLFK